MMSNTDPNEAGDVGLPRRDAGGQRDEPTELPRYHSDDAQLVIYNPKKPLAWISADPRSVVEVAHDE
jgi:hypothetical protein